MDFFLRISADISTKLSLRSLTGIFQAISAENSSVFAVGNSSRIPGELQAVIDSAKNPCGFYQILLN